ncbi:MAG: hypothetical protein OXE99_09330, partial [Cellvibrionales bacterium]|nr:hypothetical protein [Cellvibrionales bacterium]
DTYRVTNRYNYAKGNPVSLIDPTGHNAEQGLSYGLGSGFTVLGIIGAIFAVPTGGASLTLSAAAGVGAGVTTSLSGMAMMGSQMALDSGNKEAAEALHITSMALGVLAMADGAVAVAPKVATMVGRLSKFIAASSDSSLAAMVISFPQEGEGTVDSSIAVAGSPVVTNPEMAASTMTEEVVGSMFHNDLTEHTVGDIIERSVEESQHSLVAGSEKAHQLINEFSKEQHTWIQKFRASLIPGMKAEEIFSVIQKMQPESVFSPQEIKYLGHDEEFFGANGLSGREATDAFYQYVNEDAEAT